ncbi:uncharacterized protein LOC143513837 [Brachyhypopomus gauderio]|uniref:uncharacterized protein LOC143513837 n=1 Tax=Brachyhypopomus gauderio TaxID=698409 RepID=UPI0040426E78
MKIFILFLLTIGVVSAAPTVTSTAKHLLKELISAVADLKLNLPEKILEIYVPDAFRKTQCTLKNFCKAGKGLSEYEGKVLGLKKEDWTLHRLLTAYTRHTTCTDAENQDLILLHQFLEDVQHCAQKQYVNLNDKNEKRG